MSATEGRLIRCAGGCGSKLETTDPVNLSASYLCPTCLMNLVEQSSLGTPAARALRASVSDQKAAALVAEARRRSEAGDR